MCRRCQIQIPVRAGAVVVSVGVVDALASFVSIQGSLG